MRTSRMRLRQGRPLRRRLTIAAAVALLVSCATFVNSRFAGTLLQGAMSFEADTAGITGTIVDRTGEMLGPDRIALCPPWLHRSHVV
ncbi:MAG: hypothetical protein ABSG21_09685 [Spirochaetia bacterium]